jgi:hypothetical protein
MDAPEDTENEVTLCHDRWWLGVSSVKKAGKCGCEICLISRFAWVKADGHWEESENLNCTVTGLWGWKRREIVFLERHSGKTEIIRSPHVQMVRNTNEPSLNIRIALYSWWQDRM